MSSTSFYTGRVELSANDDFPYMALIFDDKDNLIREFPARTEADAKAKIDEFMAELQRRLNEDGSGA